MCQALLDTSITNQHEIENQTVVVILYVKCSGSFGSTRTHRRRMISLSMATIARKKRLMLGLS